MIKNFKFAVLLIVIAAAALSRDGGGVGMVAMGGPVILLYILSVGLAWAFGKERTAAGADQSDHAILVLIAADWIRRKAAVLLSTRPVKA